MTIGERIKAVRKRKNLTQQELAQRAGIAINSLRLYEGNKREPKVETVQRIADAMFVNLFDLIELKAGNDENQTLLQSLRDAVEQARKEGKKPVYVDEGIYFVEMKPLERLISAFESLNDEGRQKLLEYADDLLQLGKYTLTESQ